MIRDRDVSEKTNRNQVLTSTRMNQITRRSLIFGTATVGAYSLLMGVQRALVAAFSNGDPTPTNANSGPVTVIKFADDGTRLSVEKLPRVIKTADEWKKQLPASSYDVTRRAGTEWAFSGPL